MYAMFYRQQDGPGSSHVDFLIFENDPSDIDAERAVWDELRGNISDYDLPARGRVMPDPGETRAVFMRRLHSMAARMPDTFA